MTESLKVARYRNLMKYFTYKKQCIYNSSLCSFVEWFAIWLKHTVEYLDNKIYNCKQYLVQGIQLQYWMLKIKHLTFEWLQHVTAVRVNTSWRPLSSVCFIVFAVLPSWKSMNSLNRKSGVKVYMQCHEGANF